MRDLKFFGLGFGTAVLLCIGLFFGMGAWLTSRYRAEQALWRRIPIGFVVQDDLGIPALVKQGDYGNVGPDISAKNFPLPRADSHIANMGLFNPKDGIDDKQVLASIKAHADGVPRPANLDECLQYGAYIAALKSRHLFSSEREVICLGQTAMINGACVVPHLWSVDYGMWNLGTTACDGERAAGAEYLIVFTRPPTFPGRRPA